MILDHLAKIVSKGSLDIIWLNLLVDPFDESVLLRECHTQATSLLESIEDYRAETNLIQIADAFADEFELEKLGLSGALVGLVCKLSPTIQR